MIRLEKSTGTPTNRSVKSAKEVNAHTSVDCVLHREVMPALVCVPGVLELNVLIHITGCVTQPGMVTMMMLSCKALRM